MQTNACGREVPEYKLPRPSKSGVVFMPRVLGTVLGFRESARLVAIAKETSCVISITSGKKHGSTKSMLSLVSMALREGTPIVLSITGKDTWAAFHECIDVLAGPKTA